MSHSFITPLPRLAAKLAHSAIQRAQQLHAGKASSPPKEPIAINLQGLGFVLHFSLNDDNNIMVESLPKPQASTIIQASPASLLLQATNGKPGGRIEIQGDATLAQRWQHYFASLNPDWEKGLSQRLGPVLGYQLAQGLQQCLSSVQSNYRHSTEILGEYLQEESRLLVTRTEIQHFMDDIDELSERVERLLAQQGSR